MTFRPGPKQPDREEGGGSFEIPAPGTYTATIAGIWPVGRHSKTYQGETTISDRCVLALQLDAQDSRGRPFIVYDEIAIPRYWPSEKSNLWHYVETALGDPKIAEKIKDYWEIQGCGVVAQIVHNQSGKKARVKGVLGLRRGEKPPPVIGEWSPNVRPGLAKWMWEHRLQGEDAVEAAETFSAPKQGEDDGDVPF